MRNLTIQRKKSFVGCMAKMKIYIEDPVAGELMINRIRCRKLGDLKNGEQKTFQIGEQAAKVFVISDKLSRNYSNEFFELPEGQEDTFLTGKNKYNPICGNPFQFDNNLSAEALANRKKGKRRGIIVLAVSAVLGFTLGFVAARMALSAEKEQPRTFTYDTMQITLTEEFIKTKVASFDFAYATEDVVVLGQKEAFSTYPELKNYSPSSYGQAMIQSNDLKFSMVQTDGELTYFSYNGTSDDQQTYRYVVYIYKAEDAFWTVQFATEVDDAEQYADQIVRWAKTVTFDE